MWPNVSVTVSTTSGFGAGCAIVVANYGMTNKSSVDCARIVSLCKNYQGNNDENDAGKSNRQLHFYDLNFIDGIQNRNELTLFR